MHEECTVYISLATIKSNSANATIPISSQSARPTVQRNPMMRDVTVPDASSGRYLAFVIILTGVADASASGLQSVSLSCRDDVATLCDS